MWAERYDRDPADIFADQFIDWVAARLDALRGHAGTAAWPQCRVALL